VKTFAPEAAWMRRESKAKVKAHYKKDRIIAKTAPVNHIRSKSFQL
jgi:hypothetical protein